MAVVSADASDDRRALFLELEEKKKECARLEDILAEKDGALRTAREEHKLLQELHTINQMTKRKLDVDINRSNRMAISAESLARIIALEDELKLIDKRKKELDGEEATIRQASQRTQDGIAEFKGKITEIKEVTGWDRYQYASRGYVNADNLFKQHQKALAKLEEEQNGMQKLTEKLTLHIEELSKELELRKDIPSRIEEAQALYQQHCNTSANIKDEIAQLRRISQRKEKLLDERERGTDMDQKKLKELEGDKRVLHADLSRIKEQTRASEKSILAQDLKLRQIEGKLQAIAGFLVDKFVPEGTAEGEAPADGDVAREPVPVADFNALHEQLTQARYTLAQRDADLEQKDALVEALEKNYAILRAASVSRTAALTQAQQEVAREQEAIDERVAAIEEDFQREHNRLTLEQGRLRQTLDGIRRAKA